MSNNFNAPVQCSDDVGECQPAISTGPLMSSTTTCLTTSNIVEQHLELDAERDRHSRPEATPIQDPSSSGVQTGLGSAQRDRIVLTGAGDAKIEATGVAAVLDSGGTFNAGSDARIVVHKHSGKFRPPKNPAKNIKNKHKITGSQHEPGIKHLDVVSSQLGLDGRRLGRALDISDDTLDQIHLDYDADGVQEINYRILLMWKESYDGDPTVGMLAQTLNNIGRVYDYNGILRTNINVWHAVGSVNKSFFHIHMATLIGFQLILLTWGLISSFC